VHDGRFRICIGIYFFQMERYFINVIGVFSLPDTAMQASEVVMLLNLDMLRPKRFSNSSLEFVLEYKN
jgi:hypothetical protein